MLFCGYLSVHVGVENKEQGVNVCLFCQGYKFENEGNHIRWNTLTMNIIKNSQRELRKKLHF